MHSNDISQISESSIDEEAEIIKNTTEVLSKEIQLKLAEYKQSNKLYLDKKLTVYQEVSDCKKEYNFMRNSIEDVLIETKNTKKELKTMRELIDSASFHEFEAKPQQELNESVVDQINLLKCAVDLMNHRLTNNEKDLRVKESESQELKDQLSMLKENINDKTALEAEEVHASCRICEIF